MKRVLLAFVCFFAVSTHAGSKFSQSPTLAPASSTDTGTVTTGTQTFNGAKTFLNDVTCTGCKFLAGTGVKTDLVQSNSAATLNLLTDQTNGGGTGMVFKASNAFTGSNKWFDFQKNDGTSILYCDGNGICRFGGALQIPFSEVQTDALSGYGNEITLKSNDADSSAAEGVVVRTQNTFSTSGAKLLTIKNNTTEKANFDKDGHLTFADTTTNATNVILPVNTKICFNAGCTVWIMGNAGADMNMTTIGRILANAVDLGQKDLTVYTCSVTYEGSLVSDVLSGASTGNATRLCWCRSDGAGNYAYQNMRSGTVGTASTCPN